MWKPAKPTKIKLTPKDHKANMDDLQHFVDEVEAYVKTIMKELTTNMQNIMSTESIAHKAQTQVKSYL